MSPTEKLKKSDRCAIGTKASFESARKPVQDIHTKLNNESLESSCGSAFMVPNGNVQQMEIARSFEYDPIFWNMNLSQNKILSNTSLKSEPDQTVPEQPCSVENQSHTNVDQVDNSHTNDYPMDAVNPVDVKESADDADLKIQESNQQIQVSAHMSANFSKHDTPSASKHDTPSASKDDTPSASKHDTPSASKHDTPSASKHETPSASKHETPSASKHDTPSASKHETPSASKHDTPSASKHETPSASKHATPSASKHATPSASMHDNPALKHDITSASKHDTPSTSKLGTPSTSKHDIPSATKLDTPSATKRDTISASKDDTPSLSNHALSPSLKKSEEKTEKISPKTHPQIAPPDLSFLTKTPVQAVSLETSRAHIKTLINWHTSTLEPRKITEAQKAGNDGKFYRRSTQREREIVSVTKMASSKSMVSGGSNAPGSPALSSSAHSVVKIVAETDGLATITPIEKGMRPTESGSDEKAASSTDKKQALRVKLQENSAESCQSILVHKFF